MPPEPPCTRCSGVGSWQDWQSPSWAGGWTYAALCLSSWQSVHDTEASAAKALLAVIQADIVRATARAKQSNNLFIPVVEFISKPLLLIFKFQDRGFITSLLKSRRIYFTSSFSQNQKFCHRLLCLCCWRQIVKKPLFQSALKSRAILPPNAGG